MELLGTALASTSHSLLIITGTMNDIASRSSNSNSPQYSMTAAELIGTKTTKTELDTSAILNGTSPMPGCVGYFRDVSSGLVIRTKGSAPPFLHARRSLYSVPWTQVGDDDDVLARLGLIDNRAR
eukprot:scpid84347/ scgid17962/ 